MFEMTANNVAKEILQKTTIATENGETEKTIEYVKQLCVIKSTLVPNKLIFF